MKILVTGASGFTGGHLARKLLKQGHHVRAFVRQTSELPPDLDAEADRFVGDLTDAGACREALRGVSIVYHIAALYRVQGVPAKTFFDVNAQGTRNILKASEAEGVERVIHCSTVGIHGHLLNTPADEEAPFRPGDIYQRSKLEGELAATTFQRDTGLPLSVFRPTGIYGPGDMRLLKFFRIVKKRRPLIGTGKPHYHLTHVDDLTDGIILCGTHPDAVGETFILGGPDAPTLREWYDAIAKVLDVKPMKLRLPVWPFLVMGALCEAVCKPLRIEPPIHRRSVHFFTHDRVFDITKAKKTLGYNPKISLLDGMKNTAQWYIEQGLL